MTAALDVSYPADTVSEVGKNRSHNLLVQIKVNLTKINHSFAANNDTRNTAVKPQTGSNSRV